MRGLDGALPGSISTFGYTFHGAVTRVTAKSVAGTVPGVAVRPQDGTVFFNERINIRSGPSLRAIGADGVITTIAQFPAMIDSHYGGGALHGDDVLGAAHDCVWAVRPDGERRIVAAGARIPGSDPVIVMALLGIPF
eukprot:gene14254-biopygen10451